MSSYKRLLEWIKTDDIIITCRAGSDNAFCLVVGAGCRLRVQIYSGKRKRTVLFSVEMGQGDRIVAHLFVVCLTEVAHLLQF